MDKHSTRSRQHIIETESRRIVTAHFPADRFLERDQTERDYGIDMNIECFDDSEPTGAYLYLQIKGTDDPLPLSDAKTIPFDFKVKDLLRAERFITPILLIWCPVKARPTRFWFLWLQSYIRVVLNYENPSWRGQEWVRLHIPVENVVPDESGFTLNRLRFIAGHPARLEQFGQLTRITQAAPFVWDNPEELIPLLEEALGFGAIFGDDTWVWGHRMRMTVERGLEACRIALRGIDPTDEELRQIGWLTLDDPNLDYAAIKASGVIRLEPVMNLRLCF